MYDLRFAIENSVSALKLYDIFVSSMYLEHMYVFNDYVLKSNYSKENRSSFDYYSKTSIKQSIIYTWGVYHLT